MSNPVIRTRKDDRTELHERLVEVRREGRRRTILMSLVASGIVAMVLSWANDVDGVDRARKNCRIAQEQSQILNEISLQVAQEADNKKERARWIRYGKIFGRNFPPVGDNCDEIHPKPNPIPFF